jgi:quinol monooxygenase YgiN
MYGTVARFTAKPGSEEELIKLGRDGGDDPGGYLFHHVYKLDKGENEYILVVGFKDKESYVSNANSPEQNEFYTTFRSLLVSDPEWMDGEIIDSGPA